MPGKKTSRELKIEAEAKALPPISPHLVDAVIDYLMTHGDMTKPPEKTAAMLVLIDELHQRKHPFPVRAAAAKALDCNVFTIDAALSKQTADGLIEFEMRVEPGHVNARSSVVKHRYYHPSKELKDVLRAARKRKPTPIHYSE